MANGIYAVIWILLLLFIAWPVAGFCAGFWLFLQVRSLYTKTRKTNKNKHHKTLLFLTPLRVFFLLLLFLFDINICTHHIYTHIHTTFLHMIITLPIIYIYIYITAI